MKWSEFKAKVDDLLAVERRRLAAQPFIDQQIRIALGDVQRLIDYYRKGITSTLDFDDLARDGHSSRGRLARGANLREAYHVKTGTIWVRRPLHEYPFSNRHDLRAGVVNIDGDRFVFALDHRSRDFWVYPRITKGYAVQFVWDAIVGRTDIEYADDDEVPFDEPVVSLVYDWVKMKLAREVNENRGSAAEFESSYRKGVAGLFAETQERLRLKAAYSSATCVPQPCCDICGCTPCTCSCGGCTPVQIDGYCGYCPEITMPQIEWAMVGDSGERPYIQDTIEVASGIRALDPDFFFHLGDAAYPTTRRPGDVGSPVPVGGSTGGAAHLLHDLFLKHYWNFRDGNLYFAFGNHDLETLYGSPTLDALATVRSLIGSANRTANLLYYEFARGPVRFFVLNSGLNDADANIQLPAQKAWLQGRASVAAEPWLIVVFHRPAYTSDANHHPGSALMRTLTDDLPDMGIDLVINAHAHNYERFLDANGLPHVICGLGGAARRGTADPLSVVGSQFFYSSENGFLHFKADADALQWEFHTTDNEIVDRMILRKTDSAVGGGGAAPCSAVAITSSPGNRTVTEGGSTTFTVVATGTAPITYQWRKNGSPIGGATSSSYTISTVALADAGSYDCIATNCGGSATSSAAALTVNPAVVPFSVYYGKSANAILNEAEILALTTASVTSIAGNYNFLVGPGYIYWAFPASQPAAASFILAPFPVSMAGVAEGYTQVANGINFELITVGGQPYRLYRTFNTLAGAVTIAVT